MDGGKAGAPNVNMATICQSLKGTSVIENVFVQADAVNNTNSLSDISFLVSNKEDSATIKNVVVDFKNTSGIGKICGIVNVGSTDSLDEIVKVENCYTIGSLKNIVYTVANNGTVGGTTYKWGTWWQVTGSAGGYADAAAFLSAYDSDPTMLDGNAFQVVVADNGDNVLQLYNSVIGEFRTVKVLKAATNN
jgi:hypothetical protein